MQVLSDAAVKALYDGIQQKTKLMRSSWGAQGFQSLSPCARYYQSLPLDFASSDAITGAKIPSEDLVHSMNTLFSRKATDANRDD